MKTNRECNYCGRPYYCCKSCISINSWKNVCCSVECYRKLMERQEKAKIKEIQTTDDILIYGTLNDGTDIGIQGYDLSLGRFDCSDGKTRVYNDFKEFKISPEELKSIVSFLDNNNKI